MIESISQILIKFFQNIVNFIEPYLESLDPSLIVIKFFQNFIKFAEPYLKNLDPSLFQNITLGVLAIFIPFAIVFLTDILNSKNERKRSEFEKMVLSDEVLGTKKVFWLAIGSIGFFAFFSGTDIPTSAKMFSIIALFLLISLFWLPFQKILRFSEGYKPEFEITFLKKLCFSKLLKYRNKEKAEKMKRAWKSFWSENSDANERKFTEIFTSHIDDAIKFEKFELAIQLSKTYVDNIEKRDVFSTGDHVLPKVFEWNEIFWNCHQSRLKTSQLEKRIQNLFSERFFPTFRKMALSIFKKNNSKTDYFWNWHYFRTGFFQAVIKSLLKDVHAPYQLFTYFEQHIKECEKKLKNIENENERKKYSQYIKGINSSFYPTFFNEIDKAPSNYDIWEHYFPKDWKISTANIDNWNSKFILDEFVKWSRKRIFKKDNDAQFDNDLSAVINGIFPNVHSSLFKAFLMLFHSTEIKNALEKEPNFFISSISFFQSSSEDELAEMRKEKEISQQEETIQIILNYFYSWKTFKWYQEDLTEDQFENWKNFSEEERQSIIQRIRKENLEKMRNKIESTEIKEICEGFEQKDLHRRDFLELVELLILEIEK